MRKTLLFVVLALYVHVHVGTGQSERNTTTSPNLEQLCRQVQQELKKEFTQLQEELKEDINAAVIDKTTAADCMDCGTCVIYTLLIT